MTTTAIFAPCPSCSSPTQTVRVPADEVPLHAQWHVLVAQIEDAEEGTDAALLEASWSSLRDWIAQHELQGSDYDPLDL